MKFIIENGLVMNENRTVFYGIQANTIAESGALQRTLVLPDTIERIAKNALVDCSYEKVVIPNNCIIEEGGLRSYVGEGIKQIFIKTTKENEKATLQLDPDKKNGIFGFNYGVTVLTNADSMFLSYSVKEALSLDCCALKTNVEYKEPNVFTARQNLTFPQR